MTQNYLEQWELESIMEISGVIFKDQKVPELL